MKRFLSVGLICLAGLSAVGGRRDFRAPAVDAKESVPGFLWLEAEGFSDYGGWRIDTQFVHKMGSACLLAVGVGTPVAAAETTVRVPRAGTWSAWVRTKDWVPAHSPGRFHLEVGPVASPALGCSGKAGWRWERAGDYRLPAGDVCVRLVDDAGYFGRCDAIVLTTDAAYVPPEEAATLEAERLRLSGRPAEIADGGTYDVVVVGAGTTGMGAAIAAARAGARTALVNDRPVLGGNAGPEIGVGIHGASHTHPNMRETGLIEEAKLIRSRIQNKTGRHPSIAEAYHAQVIGEKKLTVALNSRVIRVEKSAKGHLTAVVATETLTGVRKRFAAKVFVDCTGDGWIGHYAGVPYRYGREGQKEFGEREAPEVPDNTTMSGVIFDNGFWSFAFRDVGKPVAYETPAWADVLPPDFTKKLKPVIRARGGFGTAWWIEHAGDVNDFEDPEGARDELIKISFAYFGWGKNKWEHRRLLANQALVAVGFIDGRRETLRLMGDYILTGEDQKAARVFPDRIAYGGWPMDTHDPLGMMNPRGNGYWREHPMLPIYTIPYRILYNPGFDNLFFAGRCSSVTHMGLGSVRVESTLATLGQVCGTAAALCAASGESPKDFGVRHMADFQQRLLKDDLYIPQLANKDPKDLARRATVTASSSQDRLTFAMSPSVQWGVRTSKIGFRCPLVPGSKDLCCASGASPAAVIDGVSRVERDVAHAWVSDARQALPQTLTLTWEKPVEVGEVRLTFDTDLMPTQPAAMPAALVRRYRLEGLVGEEWKELAAADENILRHVIHRFSRKKLSALRLVCEETWGDPSARLFEIRAYRGE